MRILVSGSHGLIGSALVASLAADDHEMVRLVRGPAAGAGEVHWDPPAGDLDLSAVGEFDAVVHLAGEGIAEKRWTAAQKQLIRDSRVVSTDLLARRLASADHPPKVLVSGSAVGIYGDGGDKVLDEDSPAGSGFLASLCQQWESATAPAADAGIRVAHLRTGIVLTPAGGALKMQLPIFKKGAGGKLASGRQYQSWIALEDEVGAIVHCITNESISGPVNLTAPNPVTNAEMTKILGSVLHRPAVASVPKFALSAALGHEMVEEMLLASQRVMPKKLLDTGYRFGQPDLEPALRSLLG